MCLMKILLGRLKLKKLNERENVSFPLSKILICCSDLYSHTEVGATDFSEQLSYKESKKIVKLYFHDKSVSDLCFSLAQEHIGDVNKIDDVLFLSHIIWSCFNVHYDNMRPSAKTKLILIVNIINSDNADKTNLLRRLFFFHSVNEDDRESCQLINCGDEIIYVRQAEKIKVIDSINTLIPQYKDTTTKAILNLTISLFEYILGKRKGVQSKREEFRLFDNGNMRSLLMDYFLNKRDVRDLYLNHYDMFSRILTECFYYYRIGGWKGDGKYKNISHFYGSEVNHKIEKLVPGNENIFLCEFFVETSLVFFLNNKDELDKYFSTVDNKYFLDYIKIVIAHSGLIDKNIKRSLKDELKYILNDYTSGT